MKMPLLALATTTHGADLAGTGAQLLLEESKGSGDWLTNDGR